MKKKRLIVGLAILIAICVLTVFLDPTYVLLGLLRNESFYQGRPTTYWSREIQKLRPSTGSAGFLVYLDKFFDLFRSTEPVKKEDLTLLKGGPEAAPVLKELLRDKEAFVRWNAAFALLDAGDVQPREVVPALCDALLEPDQPGSKPSPFHTKEEHIRYRAIVTLEEIGSEPEVLTAISALVLALADDTDMSDGIWGPDYIKDRAKRLLSRIGKPAVPALLQALKNPPSEIRVEAIRVLAEMGLAEAREAVPGLWEALNDQSTPLAATQALWKLDVETDDVVPPVLAALRDPEPSTREKAAEVLGEMGMAAEVVIPALLHALGDDNERVRGSTAVALGQFGPQARPKADAESGEVVRALNVALKDKDGHVRWHAAWALGQLGREAEPAVPALVETLKEQNGHIAGSAATSLGQIGPGAKSAVPALVMALKEPAKDTSTPTLRECAASALGALRPEDPDVPGALIGTLNDSYARWPATKALVALGPSAVPALCAALKENDAETRAQAAWALGRIGAPAKVAVPALIELLHFPNKDVRWCAAGALGEIGPDAKAAVPALRQALTDPEEWVWSHAAYALWKADPKSGIAIGFLIKRLKDDDRQRRYYAAEVLGRIGPNAYAAVPRLIEALKDSGGDHIRREAATALGRIGPAAKTAIPALAEALRDVEPVVQMEAASALGKLGPEAKAAVPALWEAREVINKGLRSKQSKKGNNRDGAQRALVKIVEALWRINGDAAEAVPQLIAILKADDFGAAPLAAETLALIGPKAREAVPILVRVLKGWSHWGSVQEPAATALGAIGPDARSAVPALIKAVKNRGHPWSEPEDGLAHAGAEALKKIDPEAAAKAGIR